jgi:hypothetical protein
MPAPGAGYAAGLPVPAAPAATIRTEQARVRRIRIPVFSLRCMADSSDMGTFAGVSPVDVTYILHIVI